MIDRKDMSGAKGAGAPVWILHDGKVGLRNQAMGVAEAVGLPFEEKRLVIRYPWKLLPPALNFCALHAPGPKGDLLQPPWPRLVIAAGGRGSAPMLAVRKAAGGRGLCVAVQVQNPHLPPGRFDLMVVPAHDRVAGDNVIVTQGAVHRVTRAVLDKAAVLWAPRLAALPHPRIAVLIGGDNGHYRLDPSRMAEIAADLARLARAGHGLMVTPSRRTGPENEAILRRHLEGLPAVVWDGSGENPYFGYLGLADHVVATADSISMITEAGATGKPVHVVELPGAGPKFLRFHQAIAQAGITRPFALTADDNLAQWEYPVADDTARAGAKIREIMETRGLWPG
ncbi:MAG TPA: mitochondrial fission ELM1 family protein [Stellaceae bacterium]|nr:mitochondrial fission ELM1 family protein [Stellaceae bacterium]